MTARTIAFYLPQFHPIPENDAWWGKGFTEWTNVAKARPAVPGHYQPHLPGDLGFYDLRLAESRAAQAELAREYMVDAFCYYHYWFNGRKLLNRPLEDSVAGGTPPLPFCICWANENWTRAWDGRSGSVLLEQNYSDEDDRAHIRDLLPILGNSEYLRVNGLPLVLVYRTELLPQPSRTAEIWREEAHKAGLGGLYLARVESFVAGVDPQSIGFDAAIEFAPDWRRLKPLQFARWQRWASKVGAFPAGYFKHRYCRYPDLVAEMKARPPAAYNLMRCVTPGFDNSPRRKEGATIVLDSTPAAYGQWLEGTLRAEQERAGTNRREGVVFVNAWNEWGEGNHLEPCERWGRAYLEAHRDACIAARSPKTLD